MKKLLISLIALTCVGSAFAYRLRVRNTSNMPLLVKAEFGGPGYCGPKQFNLNAKEKKNKNVHGCCLKKLKVRQTAGGNLKWYEGSPSRTGFGIGCKSQHFKVRRNQDGSLTVER